MTKTPKATPAKSTTKSTAKSTTKAATPTKATKAPSRRPGRVLANVQIELPRAPDHHYGSVRQASSLQVGDMIYVGTRQNLSQLEVLAVEMVTAPHHYIKIRAAAVSLWFDGVEYCSGEQVVLTAAPEARVAVRGFVG